MRPKRRKTILVIGVLAALFLVRVLWVNHVRLWLYFTPRPQSLQEIALTINDGQLAVELAHSRYERAKGLMHRDSMPEDHGMLFAYPKERKLSFWMKNTRIPLSIAYLDARKTIKQIGGLKPFDESSFKATEPVQYALEMNVGWFEKNGVKVGDRVEFELPQ